MFLFTVSIAHQTFHILSLSSNKHVPSSKNICKAVFLKRLNPALFTTMFICQHFHLLCLYWHIAAFLATLPPPVLSVEQCESTGRNVYRFTYIAQQCYQWPKTPQGTFNAPLKCSFIARQVDRKSHKTAVNFSMAPGLQMCCKANCVDPKLQEKLDNPAKLYTAHTLYSCIVMPLKMMLHGPLMKPTMNLPLNKLGVVLQLNLCIKFKILF